ncbi:MAG: RecB family exonuclease [Pontimonas sp.]
MNVTHRVPHVSASQISTFRECPRKWYFDKVVKLPRTSTSATELGSRVHAVLEAYLRGEVESIDTSDEVGQIAASGLEYLPPVSSVLEIERSLEGDMALDDAPVPVQGYVDVIDAQNNEILDHKTTSSQRYIKTQKELRDNVQMIMYATAYLRRFPQESHVTLTHIYYGTKKRWSKKVSVKVSREHVEAQWTAIKETITQMIEVSRADNAGDAPTCYEACDNYGGCPYRGQCFRAPSYLPHTDTENTPTQPTQETTNMSNMSRDERLRALGGTPTQTPPQPQPQSYNAQRPAARVLYIGCFPMKGATNPPLNAVDALAPIVEELCRSFNVPHLGVVDYGKGWSALAATLADRGWPANVSAIYLDPISKEYEHIASVLSAQADVVIKRA